MDETRSPNVFSIGVVQFPQFQLPLTEPSAVSVAANEPFQGRLRLDPPRLPPSDIEAFGPEA